MTVFNDSVKKIIEFCVNECEKQNSGLRSVIWMTQAWEFALDKTSPWTLNDILILGRKIEPWQNKNGFRYVPVAIGDKILDNQRHIRRLMMLLVDDAQFRLTPEEWYYEFELIHPFNDGNGRIGQIIFNFMNGTLLDPICAIDRFIAEEKEVVNDLFNRH